MVYPGTRGRDAGHDDGALAWQGWRFLVGFEPVKGPNLLLGGLASVLLALALAVVNDAVVVLRRKQSGIGS